MLEEQRGPDWSLSSAALAHVAALPGATPPGELALRLYLYNRLPLSPALLRSFPDEEAVTTVLLESNKLHGGALDMLWHERLTSSGRSAWRLWERRGRDGERSRPATYKLYISPALQDTGVAFRETLLALSESAATVFKVGRNLETLLRPDKLVAYFGGLSETLEAADSLATRLSGLAVQGVPFTCAVAADGILSWAMDPPGDLVCFGGSWRVLVTRQLANAMSGAPSGTVGERVAAALRRAEELAIDPVAWRTTGRTWQLLRDELPAAGDGG
jgi:hypothetical protein